MSDSKNKSDVALCRKLDVLIDEQRFNLSTKDADFVDMIIGLVVPHFAQDQTVINEPRDDVLLCVRALSNAWRRGFEASGRTPEYDEAQRRG